MMTKIKISKFPRKTDQNRANTIQIELANMTKISRKKSFNVNSEKNPI